MADSEESTAPKKSKTHLKFTLLSVTVNLVLAASLYFYYNYNSQKITELQEKIQKLENDIAKKDGAIEELRTQLDEFQY